MMPGRKKIHTVRVAGYGFMSVWILLLTACALLGPVSKPPEPVGIKESTPQGLVFQSDEYVVYRLEGNETPAMLAKTYLGDPRRAWVIEDENRDVPFKKGRRIVIPLTDPKKGGLSAEGYQAVPILCYHNFQEKCNTPLCISRDAFEQQMAYLKTHGFRVITLTELLGFLRYRHGLPDQSIVITFDDGYRSFYEIAYPILKKFDFKATLFVYTDFVGNSKNALTWEQLHELKADGYEIGTHGASHNDLTKREEGESDPAYLERIYNELVRPKAIIDERLGQDTVYIAFPYGSYNHKILQLCEQAGYTLGLSVERGSNPFFADPLALKRNQVLKKDLKDFITRLKTFNRLSLE
jgi:peptidoglycan/xylan/chitin deacetylase (PgdA/CDA1 family)